MNEHLFSQQVVSFQCVTLESSDSIAKRLAKKSIVPHRNAYLLNVFACATKGILPYDSQLLLAGNISSISPRS